VSDWHSGDARTIWSDVEANNVKIEDGGGADGEEGYKTSGLCLREDEG
jgi:hypothetical protein